MYIITYPENYAQENMQNIFVNKHVFDVDNNALISMHCVIKVMIVVDNKCKRYCATRTVIRSRT